MSTIQHEDTLKVFAKYSNFTAQTLQGKHGKPAQFYAAYIQFITYYDILNKSIQNR